MSRLRRYFNKIADRISIDADISEETINRSDIGTNRELLVNSILTNHLPKRLKASLGGHVFGFGGLESKQIDIIVANDLSVVFEENHKTFFAVESLASAITVKSFLNKEAIEDCLMNLASIPQMSNQVIDFKALRPGAFEEFIKNHPSLFVFAFDGVSLETCLTHIESFYQENPEIPINRAPRYIIVNNKYYITYTINEMKTFDGTPIPANQFYGINLPEDYRGYPYVSILNTISGYPTWLPYIGINFHKYFNEGFQPQNILNE